MSRRRNSRGQAIRCLAQIGWRPEHIKTSVSESVGAVLKPAGLDNAEGLLSASFIKELNDPGWKNDPEFADWLDFMAKYLPDADRTHALAVYVTAQALMQVLKQCRDDLTRENVMRQAASLKGLKLAMLLPGITVNTSAADFAPLEQMRVIRFTGGQWKRRLPRSWGGAPRALPGGVGGARSRPRPGPGGHLARPLGKNDRHIPSALEP